MGTGRCGTADDHNAPFERARDHIGGAGRTRDGAAFPLEIPPLGERRIELTASREQQLSDRDLRQAAYKLGCIGLY